MRFLAFLTCLIVTACANFPELEGRISASGLAAPNPRLIALDPIAVTASETTVSDETTEALLTRAAALQARSTQIRAER